ncbi:uncharacterized protein LOC111711391 isoform X4 [Eurytemora carolleeae]|uniref:uncharacterized protein LOC111711391 isoform X4 n=1 Tax=Eurytemora carolleeae TaxID=1294199 RepID=UPI000C75FD45|nr:uncharacterized protein LOC111711391 isoform X4 [Eurytemora carolleeae]XP_023341505.1 uncharacterized protein LOC111711391 isoform X4 [Eurytemora carolleeae]XP_023341506.1 uncharacterized protein LOC111711391 isoform X4 [Eurytemora carolleeae]|eukprot:XP_023341504.1 uncharacterized protein LOC111711391 isoform X4 [Eurytemora affinis]
MDKEEGIASSCKPEGSRDNRKMITSLLPLMSVLTLDNMCPDIIKHILQFLDYRSKKMLRGVSSTLKNRVEGCGDKLVHYWRFSTEFTTDQLIKFADKVETVLGFEAEDAGDDGVEYLVKKHPEILMFQLGKQFWETSKLTSTGLNEIFSLPSLSTLIIGRSIAFISRINVNIISKQLQTLQLTFNRTLNDWFLQILEQCGSTLKSLTLEKSSITGEILIKYKGTLPCLENLNMRFCKQLTNKGLLQILQLCGSSLRSLDISVTNVTGENLSEYKGTLPCLENLNMRFCKQLTDKGLLQILQLYRSTLRSLDISGTKITGENMSEYKGTLPCLENLTMMVCEQLTDKGLLQILQLCGSTLRSLDIYGTNITGENLSEYKGTLPCLENLNMSYCKQLTNKGLLQILQLCGSTLRSLDISNTNITGENLSEYKGTLPCLENLNMSECYHFTNKGVLQILQLCGSTLRSLDISVTKVTGENLSEYKGTLPCLENLNMSYCKQLTNKGLLQILQLCGSTLRSLDISNTNITGENLSEYKGTLPCLENLNMSECYHFTNKGVLQILQLCGSTLRSLDISVTKVTGENLSEYKVILPCLENLIMSSCEKFTNKGLLQILQLCGSTLRSLDISYTEITGENLSEYKGTLPCLENLDMQFCDQLINKGLLQILQLCGSTLRSLDISETKITGENLSEYKRTLPFLENLNMRDCEQLTNKGLLQILQLCGSTLRSLDISKRNITGENLSEYKGTLPCLENLNMSDFKQLTNKELLEILQLCGSTLRSLDISNTNITGENLSEYKGTLPCLENLNMRYCKQLTYKGLLQILQLCRSTLRFLDISGTNVAGENLSEYKGTFTLKTFSY